MEEGHRVRARELPGQDVSAHAHDGAGEAVAAPGRVGLTDRGSDRETFRQGLRRAWARLKGGELSPERAALSVAVGLAIGVTPLWGLHLVLVLAVCLPLRLDARVAYLAANVSLPFVAPFITLGEIQTGAWLRSGHLLPLDRATLAAHGPWAYAADLVVGTLAVAPSAAALGGTITWSLARLARGRAAEATERGPFVAAVARTAARYRRAARGYVRAKLASDPVAAAVFALDPVSLGDVVDAGCGRGQLLILLAEGARAEQSLGFDWDAGKIAKAREAGRHLPVTFLEGDLRTRVLPACDTVLLIDVLHYLDDAEQDALLARAADAARLRVVVRDLDPQRGWRSAVTRAQEAVTTAVRFNRGARVNVRPIAATRRALEARGFRVSVQPCWGRTPFANVLLVAERAVSEPPAGRTADR